MSESLRKVESRDHSHTDAIQDHIWVGEDLVAVVVGDSRKFWCFFEQQAVKLPGYRCVGHPFGVSSQRDAASIHEYLIERPDGDWNIPAI